MCAIKDNALDEKEFAMKELLETSHECVGCSAKVGLTQCNGTMCYECWTKENE